LSESRAREAIDDHLTLAIVRYPHEGLFKRVWQFRANCTAYDATYLALAEAVDAVLITCDRRLAVVPGSQAKVEVITR
jgi:predicted nucleic acid-binding protein